MEQVLPPLFIAIAAFALCLGLYAIWQSLRGVFSSDHSHSAIGPQSSRAQLVDDKTHLLQTLKDIRFERELGKISDQDFEALNARYRARAKQVLRELDAQLGPYRGRAEALIAGAPEAEAEKPAKAPKTIAKASEAKSGDDALASQRACVSCGQQNDLDAVFCKACGTRLVTESEGADTDASGGDTP